MPHPPQTEIAHTNNDTTNRDNLTIKALAVCVILVLVPIVTRAASDAEGSLRKWESIDGLVRNYRRVSKNQVDRPERRRYGGTNHAKFRSLKLEIIKIKVENLMVGQFVDLVP